MTTTTGGRRPEPSYAPYSTKKSKRRAKTRTSRIVSSRPGPSRSAAAGSPSPPTDWKRLRAEAERIEREEAAAQAAYAELQKRQQPKQRTLFE